MKILALDNFADSREVLVTRLEAALRDANIRRAEITDSDIPGIIKLVAEAPPDVIVLGPSCYRGIESNINRCRAAYPKVPIALVLSNEIYASEAVELRRALRVRVLPIADLGQMAQLFLDCESLGEGKSSQTANGVVLVLQCKGGVGASTISAALAACWVRSQMNVALVDLDDVNPQISDWAGVGASQRRLVTEAIKSGVVKSYKLRELLATVEGYDNRLSVLSQPDQYGEGFHFKADVIPDAPSISSYISSALEGLQSEFDAVIIDGGRSWGVATFAALQAADRVVCVCDDDEASFRRTIDLLLRMSRESDEPAEFDFKKWHFVVNAFTGRVLEEEAVIEELKRREMIADCATLTTIPYVDAARSWSLSKQTLFELADSGTQEDLATLAYKLVPFQFEPQSKPLYHRLRRRLLYLARS